MDASALYPGRPANNNLNNEWTPLGDSRNAAECAPYRIRIGNPDASVSETLALRITPVKRNGVLAFDICGEPGGAELAKLRHALVVRRATAARGESKGTSGDDFKLGFGAAKTGTT